MPEIETEFLFTLALEVQGFTIGDTPHGSLRMFRFDSGNFEGPKLKGTVLPGGGGTALTRRDGVLEIEARVTLETTKRANLHDLEGISPRPEGGHRSRQSRRDCRPGDVLFPHDALLRDGLGKVRLAEPDLLDCYRLAHGGRADHPGVSSIVGERRWIG